ncbi:hypothetical protein ZHAS_00016961 [Anopheles sinensis]|uniref:Uncharacterized protein n=1 Tax=Anopheles sinensis TaxID=74873 RepID=A0A084WFG6_ANOSI|nr:hypothetical protein ZHAS_00016961 [Anopheles sinensis]
MDRDAPAAFVLNSSFFIHGSAENTRAAMVTVKEKMERKKGSEIDFKIKSEAGPDGASDGRFVGGGTLQGSREEFGGVCPRVGVKMNPLAYQRTDDRWFAEKRRPARRMEKVRWKGRITTG